MRILFDGEIYYLDLSFNNITRIEGLDALTELTDLSLYNNRITVIENMDSLKKLNVFSIGNNQVDDETSVSKNEFQKKFIHLLFRFVISVDLISFEHSAYVVIHSHLNQIITYLQFHIYHKFISLIINSLRTQRYVKDSFQIVSIVFEYCREKKRRRNMKFKFNN